MMKLPRDISFVGPINGMGEDDPSGPYLKVVLTRGDLRDVFTISIGAAEVLLGELSGLLDPDKPKETP